MSKPGGEWALSNYHKSHKWLWHWTVNQICKNMSCLSWLLLPITLKLHYRQMFEKDLCKPSMFAEKWFMLCFVTTSTDNVSWVSQLWNYLHKPLHVRNKLSISLLDIKMRFILLSTFSLLLIFLHLSEAEIGNDGRTFGSCDTLRCMFDQGQASYCCNSGRNRR